MAFLNVRLPCQVQLPLQFESVDPPNFPSNLLPEQSLNQPPAIAFARNILLLTQIQSFSALAACPFHSFNRFLLCEPWSYL